MKKAYRDMGLRKKMSVLFCVLLLLLILAAGIFLSGYYHNVFQQYFQKNFSMAIPTNANGIREIFRSVDNAMDVVCDNENAYITDSRKNVSTIAETLIYTNPREDGFNLWNMVEERKVQEAMLEVLFYPAEVHALLVPGEYPVAMYLEKWSGFDSGFYRDADMEA